MTFYEKDIEDYFFDNYLTDNDFKYRQLSLLDYGVIDCITFNYDVTGETLNIDIYEIKNVSMTMSDVLQVYRYVEAVKDIFDIKQMARSVTITPYVVVPTLNTNSDHVFFIQNQNHTPDCEEGLTVQGLEVIEFNIDLQSGIKFNHFEGNYQLNLTVRTSEKIEEVRTKLQEHISKANKEFAEHCERSEK